VRFGLHFRVIVLLGCALGTPAQSLVSKLDTYLGDARSLRSFMGTALVARGGTILLDKGYGYASLELNVPNTPANKFRIGSITKQFTAAAIMQLQEQGKLNVSDQACKYIDNCPDAWKPVTIRELLSHTSGIPSYTSLPSFATPKFMRIPLSPMEVLMVTRDKPLAFPPGEKWAYDNTGYIFLGIIIEKVSGRSYADYLEEHIFAPLGMTHSGYDNTRAIVLDRAAGYDRAGNGLRNADYIDMSLPFAAGSLYSTTGDLYRWDRALYTEKVVTRKSYEAMTTPVKDNYGYGLVLAPLAGHKQVGHGGGINGFSTCINRFPDDDAVVIVLANVVQADACRISKGLAEILFTGKTTQ
jgi:D-alanyl-D-alanine carboxypeptidase